MCGIPLHETHREDKGVDQRGSDYVLLEMQLSTIS